MESAYSSLLARTSPEPFFLDIDRAEGIYIWDKQGRRYTDLISGISVSNLGHGNPAVIRAIHQQVDQYLHVMVYGEFGQDPQVRLAEALIGNLPERFEQVFLVNSGTEANEAAMKLARRYTGRAEIVSFQGAYHGNTMGSLSASGNEKKKYPFRPLVPGFRHIRFNEMGDLSWISESTAAVIVEPIQGDAGVRIPSLAYMQALRSRCNETGALLIFDEIQTGMGRTGKLFACEHFGVEPDILTLAKALGGGMPIGAFISSKAIMESLTVDPPLGHITTFGGHPVVCAAAYAALQELLKPGILDDVERKGALIEQLLHHPLVKEIRRVGMFFAIELQNADVVQQVVTGCRDEGIISYWFLSCPESFRIAPPLVITDAQISESCSAITRVMDRVFNTDQNG
jgi:acetylornithine/succinyldiaminopimelate/putrescine aminotransferase